MKSYTLPLTAIAAIIGLASCKNNSLENKFAKLEKMKWMIGSWEQKLPEGTISETWLKKNDSTFIGKSYFIKKSDTIHLESIVLTQKDDALLYIPTVSGQNNNEAVDFKLTSDAENIFTFENPAHDYPQKIVYKKIDSNNLVATISGKQQGKETKESYPMVKK